MNYCEVAIWVQPVFAESLAWHLQGMGVQGVGVSEVPAVGPVPDTVAVRVYQAESVAELGAFEARIAEGVADFAGHFDGLDYQIMGSVLPSEDWESSWKRHWHTQCVGERLVIKPSWENFQPASHQIVIELDPKQAFGTGTHPTTQLCLQALERSVGACDAPFVHDVGTGSGILGIAALKLGARQVLACDTDPVATGAARENADANQVLDRFVVHTGGIEVLTGEADIVVINILAEVIVDLAEAIAARVRPGGLVIASGIIRSRQESVERAFQAVGLLPQTCMYQGEWLVLEASKPGPAPSDVS
jgi:ribosomal protein L11 methyltransferase